MVVFVREVKVLLAVDALTKHSLTIAERVSQSANARVELVGPGLPLCVFPLGNEAHISLSK